MFQTELSISISPCSESDFPIVKKFIADFSLDDTDLRTEQFLVAKNNEEIIGFVRYKKYSNCGELCSLGVVENYRLKGVGSKLVEAILKKHQAPLYIVVIIPEFFTRFGFQEVTEYPPELLTKLKYCENSLCVPEKYVVMLLK